MALKGYLKKGVILGATIVAAHLGAMDVSEKEPPKEVPQEQKITTSKELAFQEKMSILKDNIRGNEAEKAFVSTLLKTLSGTKEGRKIISAVSDKLTFSVEKLSTGTGAYYEAWHTHVKVNSELQALKSKEDMCGMAALLGHELNHCVQDKNKMMGNSTRFPSFKENRIVFGLSEMDSQLVETRINDELSAKFSIAETPLVSFYRGQKNEAYQLMGINPAHASEKEQEKAERFANTQMVNLFQSYQEHEKDIMADNYKLANTVSYWGFFYRSYSYESVQNNLNHVGIYITSVFNSQTLENIADKYALKMNTDFTKEDLMEACIFDQKGKVKTPSLLTEKSSKKEPPSFTALNLRMGRDL